MPGGWRDESLRERFAALTELLKAGERFWRHHAFQMLRLPWEDDFPRMASALRALALEASEQLARDDRARLDVLSVHHSLFASIAQRCEIGRFDAAPLPDIESRDIPGRKWQQIRHFLPHVPANEFAALEWCAGKAHVGRTLACQGGCAVTALEYDARLIDEGETLAARAQVAIDFRCVDAMSPAASTLLQPGQNLIALHVCGDLHTRMLRLAAQARTATITLAPCCYHLVREGSSGAISAAAKASGLQLLRDDLRTAVHGTATAAARQVRQRQQLQAWRLGFDLLQREVRGCDEYLPTPSLAPSVLADGFAAVCRKIAGHKRIELPHEVDFSRYERAGWERLREVTALNLPRLAFRRALELWLVLDRALFLQEGGYRVEVGLFCAPILTPRNILIRAVAAT